MHSRQEVGRQFFEVASKQLGLQSHVIEQFRYFNVDNFVGTEDVLDLERFLLQPFHGFSVGPDVSLTFAFGKSVEFVDEHVDNNFVEFLAAEARVPRLR